MEDNLKKKRKKERKKDFNFFLKNNNEDLKKMEDNLKKNSKKKWKTTSKKMKMEDDLNKTKIKWKTNQSTNINLIGCDTIVNSPSLYCYCFYFSCLWTDFFVSADMFPAFFYTNQVRKQQKGTCRVESESCNICTQ